MSFGCVGLGSPRPAVAGRAHARLRADLLTQSPQSPRRGGSTDAAGSGEELLKLVVRTHLTTRVSNTGTSKITYRQQLKRWYN